MMQSVLTFFLDGKAPRVYNKDSDRSAGSVMQPSDLFDKQRLSAAVCPAALGTQPRFPRMGTQTLMSSDRRDRRGIPKKAEVFFLLPCRFVSLYRRFVGYETKRPPACGERIPHRAADRPLKIQYNLKERNFYGKKTKQQGPRDDARRPE